MPRLVATLATLVAVFFVGAAHAQGSKVQQHADREALKAALENVLAHGPLSSSRVGVQVVSLDTGEVLVSHHANDLLNPASNVKLFTSAAALSRLGPEFRFETEFYTDKPLQRGKARVLYVRGKGDPSVNTERLYAIAGELAHQGLREVTDIVVDDTWFDQDRVPPGYDQESSDRAYMAPPGALSLNWNAVGIYLRAGERPGERVAVEVEPQSDFFVVEGRITTSSRRNRRFSVTSEAAGEKQKIVATGSMAAGSGTWSVWKKIDNPPMYFGYSLKALLATRGVKVKGKVKLGTVAPDAKLLHVAQSDTLDLIIKRLNKVSSNFIAEQLVKTLGAEVKGPPGNHAKGIEVIEEFLASDVRIPRGSYVMKNGSGLNDANRFSPAQVTRLLVYMGKLFPTMPEYLSSLGIAGKDGTLRYRFEGSDAVGRLRAKTGTLENVTALSGYVVAMGGERFIFSMMVNDYPGRAGPVIQGLDAIGAAVASLGSTEGPSRAVAVAVNQPPRPSSVDEVKTRVRTYLALAAQADKRNISFLRTAWRNEKDPAVRVVVADSLYRSDPQDYLGVRTLLDSFAPTPEVYGRLRDVARELEVEVPGLESIIDLGAEGNTDALSRLVDLCRASENDAAAQRELSGALSEIARTAPEELLHALRSAPEPDRDGAAALLARGLADAAEPDHPLWRTLKKSAGAQDQDLAAFAKTMEASLTKQISDAKAPRSPQVVPASAENKDRPMAETRPGG